MNFSNLSKAQLLYSYNAEETVCRPIDWNAITHANAPPKTPKDVRDYLNNVVARMNQHLAVVMHGPMTGKIMVTRQSRIAGTETIFVSCGAPNHYSHAKFISAGLRTAADGPCLRPHSTYG